jgi:hypothetical protein
LPKRPKEIYLEYKNLEIPQASPDLRFITYRLSTQPKNAKSTVVPNYVTESGFTEDIPGRTKVGNPLAIYESFVYDVKKDTAYQISTKDIIGISEKPEFLKDYKTSPQPLSNNGEGLKDGQKKDSPSGAGGVRKVTVSSPIWSEDSKNAVVVVNSADYKDRWIMLLDATKGKLKLLDRQHDEAWIGGPGVGFAFGGGNNVGWLDSQTIYFQSEADGYSHLYSVNVATGEKKQI